jgi:hypothetical protein
MVAYLCGVRPALEKGATEPGLGEALPSHSSHHLPIRGEGSDFDLRWSAVPGDGDPWVTRRQ